MGTFLSVAVLWVLIYIFTDCSDSSQSFGEAWIVVIGLRIARYFSALLLDGLLGPFSVVINIVALYLLVAIVCGTTWKITIKICAWYLGMSYLVGILSLLLA